MINKFFKYRSASFPLPDHQWFWPLYGAGLENMGVDGKPIRGSVPLPNPDQLLVRHDACSLCFSDTKVIHAGEQHPRLLGRNMLENPVILGHEISLTVVRVGKNLKNKYYIGQRFTIQPDIYRDGISTAYGYALPGGLSQYNLLGGEVLAGDDGNYLLPLKPETGYAEAALSEPWACVVAAYQQEYRTGLASKGTFWIIDSGRGKDLPVSEFLTDMNNPSQIMLTTASESFRTQVRNYADFHSIQLVDVPTLDNLPVQNVDDILFLGNDPIIIESLMHHLAIGGVVAIVSSDPVPRPVSVDLGRIHYNRWMIIGTESNNLATAYKTPIRSNLKPGGNAWFIGAGGPMGRMHVQRAIQQSKPPNTIICTDINAARLNDLQVSLLPVARQRGVRLVCLNPANEEEYTIGMQDLSRLGFDDIVVLAPVAHLIAQAATCLAPGGVMNLFAGLPRGTTVPLDLNPIIDTRQVRYIGSSGSRIQDQQITLDLIENGGLMTNHSVAAISGLLGAREGMRALIDGRFSGKVVVYPQLLGLGLYPISELKEILPSVHAHLSADGHWTNAAENELFKACL